MQLFCFTMKPEKIGAQITMKKKIIVGIMGSPGSGKETVSKLITEKFSGKVHHVMFSSPLTSFLLDMGYKKEDIDRPTLQLLGQKLNKHFGDGTVTRGALLLIKNSTAPIDIVDGVRWESDFKGLKSLASHSIKVMIIYVIAYPEIRWGRVRKRKQRAGEAKLSWEEFLRQDNAPNERFIEKLGAQADFHIDNNNSREKLRKQVLDLCTKHIC